MDISVDQLLAACGDSGEDAGIRMTTTLEPTGGPGTPIKPAIYAGPTYQHDKRWWGKGEDRQVVDAIVIDNEPSQVNRLEAALEDRAEPLGLPRVVLDLTAGSPLPPHLPGSLTGYRFPHRHADAYLRDAVLDGERFPRSDIGRALFTATADRPTALFEWFPQALLFGFWQSHLGKGAGASQAKLARSWRSAVVGYMPAATGTRQFGLKGDPLNLTLGGKGRVHHDPLDESDWDPLVDGKAPKERETAKLSEIGHGQVIVAEGGEQPPGPAGISFAAIEQVASVSFADLRRVWVQAGQPNAAARALLVALGLLAHVDAFGRPFSLRSGCDLRPVDVEWTWLGAHEDEDIVPLSPDDAVGLLRDCVRVAEGAGLPVGSRWPQEPLTLQPSDQLVSVIRSTYPEVS